MHHSIGTWIMWGGMAGWFLWAIATSWPARRTRRLTLSAAIAAPAERIWKAQPYAVAIACQIATA